MKQPDHEIIQMRLCERAAKIAEWEREIEIIQNRIAQYRRMAKRDREYLNGSTDEEI